MKASIVLLDSFPVYPFFAVQTLHKAEDHDVIAKIEG